MLRYCRKDWSQRVGESEVNVEETKAYAFRRREAANVAVAENKELKVEIRIDLSFISSICFRLKRKLISY